MLENNNIGNEAITKNKEAGMIFRLTLKEVLIKRTKKEKKNL